MFDGDEFHGGNPAHGSCQCDRNFIFIMAVNLDPENDGKGSEEEINYDNATAETVQKAFMKKFNDV